MDVLILEDENIAADNLEHMIKQYDSNIRIVAKIDSVGGAVAWLNEKDVDLIFIDVHLADDISFKIFEKMEVKTPLIFTTAYDQYAIRAFKLNSIDYLLKPIDKKDLAKAIDKYKAAKSHSQVDINELLKAFTPPKTEYQKRFFISLGDKVKSVPVSDIAYWYAYQKYVLLVTNKNERHYTNFTMEKLDSLLDPEIFFRINRKFIINFSAIKSMSNYSKSRIKITLSPESAEEAVVSIDKSEGFKKWLNR